MPEMPRNKTRQRQLLAVFSGLLLTGASPPSGVSWLAGAALIPLFYSLDGASPLQALKLGLFAGMTHYLTLLYWIIFVLDHYSNLNMLLSFGPYLLLCFYLSLFVAVFSWGTVHFTRSFPFPWFFAAGLWVSLEYVRAHFLTGFPWCLLGYSQHAHLHLIQVADIAGVYGVSFLIVLVNGLLFALLSGSFPRNSFPFLLETSFALALVVATVLYGSFRLHREQGPAAQPPLKCAVIQPDIDQSVKWDPAYQAKTMGIYRRLTLSVFSAHPRLIVWPETALPFYFQDRSDLANQFLSLARASHADLLFGSPAYERKGNEYVYYNRAYLLTADGRIRFYDKVHLVPFGEYVPLKQYLFFVTRLVTGAGDFEPGTVVSPFRAGKVTIGPLICFEAIFPELARIQVKKGAEILVNLTNDAWFGATGAPYQHLAMAAFRAVETRRPLIRAANTGISAFISPTGKIQASSALFKEQILIRVVHPSSSPLTFYVRFGDIFALSFCLISVVTLAGISFLQRKRGGKKQDWK